MTTTPSNAQTSLLLALDPIVQCWQESGSPVGDPMGLEHWTKQQRLSEAVHELGWDRAFSLPESARLLRAIGGDQ